MESGVLKADQSNRSILKAAAPCQKNEPIDEDGIMLQSKYSEDLEGIKKMDFMICINKMVLLMAKVSDR